LLLRGWAVIGLAPNLFANMPRRPTHPDLTIVTDARSFEHEGYFLQTLCSRNTWAVMSTARFHSSMPEQTIDSFAPDCVTGPHRRWASPARGSPRAIS